MAVPFKPNTIATTWTPQTARDIDDVLNDIYRHLRALTAVGGSAGVDGEPGRFVVGDAGDDGEPGPPGVAGVAGPTGAQGPTGPLTLGPMSLQGEDGEDAWPIPGARGDTGAAGAGGASGPAGPMTLGPMSLHGEDGEDGWSIPGPAGAAGSNGSSAAWTLAATQVCAGAANYDFTGLSAYSEFIVLLNGVTLSTNTIASLLASVDNGSSFLSTYYSLNVNGARTAETELLFWSGNSASDRYAVIHILAANTSCPVKPVESWSGTKYYITTSSAINALRVAASGGYNLNSGTIYVFGR